MKRLIAWLLALGCTLGLCVPALALTPMASPDDLPETTEEGFLPEGQDALYFKDHTGGRWFFIDQTCRVEIQRYQTKTPLQTYYIADIMVAEGSSLTTYAWNQEHPGRTNALPKDIADAARAVYAQSGDFYSYRVSNDRYPGSIVRDGKVLYAKSYSKLVDAVPNLATMGFYPSGRAEVNEAWEKSAQDYVDGGATTVVAFGPLLVREGEMQDVDKKEYNYNEPRCCIGIIEPGHYVGFLMEGRKSHSEGATLLECAQILLDYGVSDAINLDGGGDALFRGERAAGRQRRRGRERPLHSRHSVRGNVLKHISDGPATGRKGRAK